ncbi:MAG: acyltransferase domain-containing protein, partial [Verrucomicrobiota bacterium]
VFREAFDRCAAVANQELDVPLEQILFSGDDRALINETRYTQPALFAVSYAQAQRFLSWGIQPEAVAGHSIGEYVAATLAGVMSAEDAMRIVCLRGALMQSMEPGSMLAVMIGKAEVEALIADHSDIDLAAANSSVLTVVAGPDAAIEKLAAELDSKNVRNKALRTSHAFHSAMMEPMLDEFTAAVAKVQLHAPQIPYPSNVSGTWISDAQATSAEYYARQIRSAVSFADNLDTILEQLGSDSTLFLEMGPGRTLTTFASDRIGASQSLALPTLPSPKDEEASDRHTLHSLGKVWSSGFDLDWEKVQPAGDWRKVSLPAYQWNEKTYRVEAPVAQSITGANSGGTVFHTPIWKQSFSGVKGEALEISGTWLVFADHVKSSEFRLVDGDK